MRIREYQSSLVNGYLQISFPNELTEGDIEDMLGLFALIQRQLERKRKLLQKSGDTDAAENAPQEERATL